MKLEFRGTTKKGNFGQSVPIGQIHFLSSGEPPGQSMPINCESFPQVEAEVAKIKSDLDQIIAAAKTFFRVP
jgi:hypothetical protein